MRKGKQCSAKIRDYRYADTKGYWHCMKTERHDGPHEDANGKKWFTVKPD